MKASKTARKAAGNLKYARRNMLQSAKLAAAAGGVIAARTRLAVASDHHELTRMVPEKVVAFGAAGFAFGRHAIQVAAQASLNATSEWTALRRHAAALARARSPFAVALIQANGAWAWWERMAAQSVDFGSRMMRAQHAIAVPIERAAHANATRLMG